MKLSPKALATIRRKKVERHRQQRAAQLREEIERANTDSVAVVKQPKKFSHQRGL